MNKKDKHKILQFISECGLTTTRNCILDNPDDDYLCDVAKQIDFPVKIMSNNETHALNTVVYDPKEFIYIAKVYITNFDEILITKVLKEREKKVYTIGELKDMKHQEKIEKLFNYLQVDEFHAYGYQESEEFYFEEIITPKDLVFNRLAK